MVSGEDQEAEKTKACNQCKKQCTKFQFAKKQWKKANRSCRLCAEYTQLSQETSRSCNDCHIVFPRTQFDIYQWGKGDNALCHSCRDALGVKILDSIGDGSTDQHTQLSDGTCVCTAHSLECCDICMMDFTLPNQFTIHKNAVGRNLTEQETNDIIAESTKDIRISRKICILDGQPVCPRSGEKMRCPCNEVTYCSKACQKHHWSIHKMTCKVHAEKKKAKAKKASKKVAASGPSAKDLTEEQKNFARMEAMIAENKGREGSIDDCAWQLGEHPFVIGGGSMSLSAKGEEFVKGDVAKIFMERCGVEWDGDIRFGVNPYVPRKNTEDWIAKALKGKSQRQNDFEKGFRF